MGAIEHAAQFMHLLAPPREQLGRIALAQQLDRARYLFPLGLLEIADRLSVDRGLGIDAEDSPN